MLGKLSVLLHSKVGVALLGALLVAGGGSGVAVMAAHGDLGGLESRVGGALVPAAATAAHDENEGHQDGTHLSLEGTLTGYDATAGTITVTFKSGQGEQDDAGAPSASHTPEADESPEATHTPEADESPEATHAAGADETPEATHAAKAGE
jgi:hypothetical protein